MEHVIFNLYQDAGRFYKKNCGRHKQTTTAVKHREAGHSIDDLHICSLALDGEDAKVTDKSVNNL